MWLKAEEPDLYRDAAWFVNIKDYLYGQVYGAGRRHGPQRRVLVQLH